MLLRHIDRGTRLQIRIIAGQRDEDDIDIYDALFYDIYDSANESSFTVQCTKMNRNYSNLGLETVLEIEFTMGPEVHTFTGRVIGKTTGDMVIIEQLTDIDTSNRRYFQRDEIRVDVRLFGLPAEMINERKYALPAYKPAISDVSFDLSAGGICIVTNKVLKSEHDPYYLVEFSLSNMDKFLLPAKVVRISKFMRSKIGKYDYGFQFIFDNMPDEKSRLTKAILNRKLSYL